MRIISPARNGEIVPFQVNPQRVVVASIKPQDLLTSSGPWVSFAARRSHIINKILPLVLVIAVIAGLSSGGVLQTTGGGYTYVFPRIEAPGLQLIVSNISTASTAVRATFYLTDGSIAQSLRFSMSAGTQTIVDDSSAALGSFLGTAVVESTTPLSVTATTTGVGVLDTAVRQLQARKSLFHSPVGEGTRIPPSASSTPARKSPMSWWPLERQMEPWSMACGSLWDQGRTGMFH